VVEEEVGEEGEEWVGVVVVVVGVGRGGGWGAGGRGGEASVAGVVVPAEGCPPSSGV
jgi:hypothetical protein